MLASLTKAGIKVMRQAVSKKVSGENHALAVLYGRDAVAIGWRRSVRHRIYDQKKPNVGREAILYEKPQTDTCNIAPSVVTRFITREHALAVQNCRASSSQHGLQ